MMPRLTKVTIATDPINDLIMPMRVAALELQGAIGSSGLERIGFEHCGPEASKCNWLERARTD
jgi:hypothetical protein